MESSDRMADDIVAVDATLQRLGITARAARD
jgi:hypothetical protein